MGGDIENGIELPTQRWQCSGCDHLCGALLPGSVPCPPWSCSEAIPAWQKVDPETVHEMNVQLLSIGRMVQELERRGATWMEFEEGDSFLLMSEYNPATTYRGPMTVLIIKRPYETAATGVGEACRKLMEILQPEFHRPLPENPRGDE